MTISLTQEEMDAVNYDAREGDLDTLKEIFTEIEPLVLTTIQDENTLSTPIHMAAANGHLNVVEYLLSILPRDEATKIASKPNESGNTPLHWAAYNGHLDIVKLLCQKYDSDVFAKNAVGHDSMFEAENNGHSDVENWFLSTYAPENAFEVEENGEETKITYTPGDVSREADEEANKAQKNASGETESSASENRVEGESIEQKTEKLTI